MNDQYWGHSENDNGNGIPEPLRDHVEAVARLSSTFAARFGAAQSAEAAAWFHDLGKFADQMQQRLRGRDPVGRDHWSAGAAVALQLFANLGTDVCVPIAASILGHHVGLSQYWIHPAEAASAIKQWMEDAPDNFTDIQTGTLLKRHQAAGFPFPQLSKPFRADLSPIGSMLDTRMLFSTLVDADFLETEAHFEGDAETPRRSRQKLTTLHFQKALKRVEEFVAAIDSSRSEPDVQRMRSELFQSCLTAGKTFGPGVYTLAAPTGAGKTLAMLAFALGQAQNSKTSIDRIVLSMPFLNIIDQTADEYRRLFAEEFQFDPHSILEDHSTAEFSAKSNNLDDNERTDSLARLRRLSAENWDASVVLTTNVKLLESLHANGPARCRKLHRLANSVILFDEVQTIPPKLVKPTLATLAHLAKRYQATIVFATATQPAFDHLTDSVRELAEQDWLPKPIVKNNDWMFQIAARRVTVDWRIDTETLWTDLANQLTHESQSVCIVNLKRHAQQLVDLLAQHETRGLKHLSTNMCQLHRKVILEEVATALTVGSTEPLCLISTQCIEAGVNLDSPVMYRSLAPLEAIAQAAGRCNRHGLRKDPGKVVVFKPENDGRTAYPPGYDKAAEATETFLRHLRQSDGSLNDTNILNSPALIRRYYQQFYDLNAAATDHKELTEAIHGGDFQRVAEKYRLISGDQITILVPYHEAAFEELKSQIQSSDRGPGFVRNWINAARPHAVSIHRPKCDSDLWSYLQPLQFRPSEPVDNDTADWFVLLDGSLYDSTLGLKTEVEFDGII